MTVPDDGHHGKWWLPNRRVMSCMPFFVEGCLMTLKYPSNVVPQLRPQVRRDYPLSLSISISGGKETYKDSPSNGERTGNSPA
jgi:hypothetical protein